MMDGLRLISHDGTEEARGAMGVCVLPLPPFRAVHDIKDGLDGVPRKRWRWH